MRPRLAILLALACPPAAFGWGEDGHVIVSRIAETYLEPTTRQAIEDLLGKDETIATPGVCLWPDNIRSKKLFPDKYPNNDKWHYINIELKKKYLPLDDNDNVVGAVERFAAVLADPLVPKEERVHALKFVVHFVGDMHQPLHCSNRNNDRGGNLVRVKSVLGKAEDRLNLHWVWDSHIVKADMAGLMAADYAERLVKEVETGHQEAWRKGDVLEWAWGVHEVAVKTVYHYADGSDLPAPADPKEPATLELTKDNYVEKNRPVVREQLKKAGVRLAKVLNDCLDKP